MYDVKGHREKGFITVSFRDPGHATYPYLQNQEVTISTCSSRTDFDTDLTLQKAGMESALDYNNDGTSGFYT